MQTIEQLQQQLADANAAYRSLIARGRSSHVLLSEYSAASERVLTAERALAAACGDQYAVPLDLGYVPEAAVSGPIVLQNDYSTFLTFNAVVIGPDGSRGNNGTAVIEFDLCFWTSFGYPNDEALAGHPLHGRGLSAYRIFDIHNSRWGRRMVEQNRVAFPKTKDFDSRHLIFSFHDSTFECLCRGIKSSSFSEVSYADIFSGMTRKILEKHDG